jgi:hypothetical protein
MKEENFETDLSPHDEILVRNQLYVEEMMSMNNEDEDY